jgi:exopolysaccharide biosynthesis polyprenyl glycosylphosphotransferase
MSTMTSALPSLAAPGANSTAPEVDATGRHFNWPNTAAKRRIPAARAVAAIDAIVVTAALVAQVAPGGAPGIRELLSLSVSVQAIVLLAIFAESVVVVFYSAGLYDAARVRRAADEAGRVVLSMTALAVLLLVAARMIAPGISEAGAVLDFWAIGTAAVVITRGARVVATRRFVSSRRALIVGSGPHALRICRNLSADPFTCYQVLGFVDTNLGTPSAFVKRRTVGSLDDLERILVREHIDEVHIGLPVRSHYSQIQETVRVCERVGVKMVYPADIFDTALARPRVGGADGVMPCVQLRVVADGPALAVKRAIDVVGAAVGLVLLSPLMIAAALAVKLTSEGPLIYAQERFGLNRRRFRMLKFRTMVQNADRLQAALEAQNEAQGPVFKIARDPRITPVGRWLRRTSIDELPQLFNVLHGDMSLIGPRPLPLRDVALFTRSADMRRFSVRPGITGLWQVSGRSTLGFDQWITLDLHYIDNWSLALDFIILARTIPAVIRGTGAA